MKRKWFLTLILPFLLCIVSGFSPPQDQKQVERKTDSDTLTVDVKFSNPQLTIRDQRNIDIFQGMLEEMQQSDNSVATAINNASDGYISIAEKDQERRYESALDYLERVSGYTPTEIENFIKQKRLSEMISSIVLIVSLIAAMFYVASTVIRASMDWRQFLTKVIGLTLGILILYNLLSNTLFPILYPEGYRFYSLINLSG